MMSTSNKICNESASKLKSNNDGVCEVNSMLHNMSTTDDNKDDEVLDMCANCGKEGNSNDMNICNRCKMVKYCNAICKKKHRSKHKKKCDRRIAELHDEQLFKQPPQEEDCPICFLRMPALSTGWRYQSCCGKLICGGCSFANAKINLKKQLCAFCRAPAVTSYAEAMKRVKKRADVGDVEAIFSLGVYHAHGMYGFPQDQEKAIEFYRQAAELGHAAAYYNIGCAYEYGRRGVEVNMKKAKHFYELAAMMGHVKTRNNLGCIEERADNMERARKHWLIAVKDGHNYSLATIQKLHSIGLATKEEYTQALRSYQAYLGEIRSAQRDEAAASNDKYKYIDRISYQIPTINTKAVAEDIFFM